MTKKIQISIIILYTTIFLGCGNRQSATTFKNEKIFDAYSIKIPDFTTKQEEGVWLFKSDEEYKLLLIKTNIIKGDGKSISEHLENLIDEIKAEDSDGNKVLIKKDSLNFNNLKGISAYFEQDNSTGAIPVMTYYIVSILQDGEEIIKINAVTTEKVKINDIETTIHSIKKATPDSTKIASVNQPKVELNINKIKQEGYQIFEKENFVIKCPAKLKLNTELVKQQKAIGNPLPMHSYQGYINPNNPNKSVIYGIDITDLSIEYNKLPNDYLKYFANTFSKGFSTDEIVVSMINGNVNQSYQSANITYSKDKFNGVEYYYMIASRPFPAKAMFFINDKKIYTLLVGSNNNLDKRFNELKNSFKFLK